MVGAADQPDTVTHEALLKQFGRGLALWGDAQVGLTACDPRSGLLVQQPGKRAKTRPW